MLETIPRPFTRIHKNNQSAPLFVDRPYAENARKPRVAVSATSRVRYGDHIPDGPSHAILSLAKKRRRGAGQVQSWTDLLAALKDEVFAVRPAWLKKVLEEMRFGEMGGGSAGTSYLLGELLPMIAFTYTSGPWKGTSLIYHKQHYGYYHYYHRVQRLFSLLLFIICSVSN